MKPSNKTFYLENLRPPMLKFGKLLTMPMLEVSSKKIKT